MTEAFGANWTEIYPDFDQTVAGYYQAIIDLMRVENQVDEPVNQSQPEIPIISRGPGGRIAINNEEELTDDIAAAFEVSKEAVSQWWGRRKRASADFRGIQNYQRGPAPILDREALDELQAEREKDEERRRKESMRQRFERFKVRRRRYRQQINK